MWTIKADVSYAYVIVQNYFEPLSELENDERYFN